MQPPSLEKVATLFRRPTIASVFLALVVGCATSSTTTPHGVEPRARDPWALPTGDEGARRCPLGEQRCERGVAVPQCGSALAASEVTPIGSELADKVGERVTVVARPNWIGIMCTLVNCACCNSCSGPLALCGGAGCEHAILIGSCAGDPRLICCSIALEDRPLVATGVLRALELEPPIDGSEEPEDEAFEAPTRFALEQPEYCYLSE